MVQNFETVKNPREQPQECSFQTSIQLLVQELLTEVKNQQVIAEGEIKNLQIEKDRLIEAQAVLFLCQGDEKL